MEKNLYLSFWNEMLHTACCLSGDWSRFLFSLTDKQEETTVITPEEPLNCVRILIITYRINLYLSFYRRWFTVHAPSFSCWFCSSYLSLEDRWQKRGTGVKNFSYKSNTTTTDQYVNCDKNTNTSVFSPSTYSSVFITAVLPEKCRWTSSHHWLLVTSFWSSPSSSNHPLVLLFLSVHGESVALALAPAALTLPAHTQIPSFLWKVTDEMKKHCCVFVVSRRLRKSIAQCFWFILHLKLTFKDSLWLHCHTGQLQ